jgi:hypothetical protein
MERQQLADLVVRFTEAFNRKDLDGVMSFMAEDAIYDEFNGRRSRGKQAIPGFSGSPGTPLRIRNCGITPTYRCGGVTTIPVSAIVVSVRRNPRHHHCRTRIDSAFPPRSHAW